MFRGIIYGFIAMVLVIGVVSFPYHKADARRGGEERRILTKDYILITCECEEDTGVIVTPPAKSE